MDVKKDSGKLDLLFDLYSKGIVLEPDKINLLKEAGYIVVQKLEKKAKEKQGSTFKTYEPTVEELKKELDSFTSIDPFHVKDLFKDQKQVILPHESYDKFQETSHFKYATNKVILKEDWMPHSLIDHTKAFVIWIDSINSGFQYMTMYDPFRLYCQQAADWLLDTSDVSDFDNEEDQKEWLYEEFAKCSTNALYFIDKYVMLKEGDEVSGTMKYLSKPVHKVLCYLVNCGYSIMAGKPRQIAATSTLGAIALWKLVFQKNYFIKFLTMDEKTGLEIFEDKIKYPFSQLPPWLQPSVLNDRDNLFRLGEKSSRKGNVSGVNSKLKVDSPSVSAINGGSPQLVMIDEAGYISFLGKMMLEGRPTMFKLNQKTGKLEQVRQVIIWGTGGEMDKGGKAYESEFYACLDKWKDGDFEYGIIPLFFDWTTRPGISKDQYEKEKKNYTVKDSEREAKLIQFRQHYPSSIEDMFLSSYNLLMGAEWINSMETRIKDSKTSVTAGYFEPVFDQTKPIQGGDGDFAYEIVGANFIPVSDDQEDLASVWIFSHPKKDWMYRYYKGTDPIASDTGYSNFASVIWDNYFLCPAAVMNYRERDHQKVFMQSLLLSIYYKNEREEYPKDLVEINIGTAYTDFVEKYSLDRWLTYNKELLPSFQGGGSLLGVDNRGRRTELIINKLRELLMTYGENIFFLEVFKQLRTFSCTFTEKGTSTWGTANYKIFKDDILFAMVFAYINACSDEKIPINLKSESLQKKMEYKMYRDSDGKLNRRWVKV